MSEIYEWSKPETIQSLSKAPFGKALMNQVAIKLEKGHKLEYNHRDYCGLGLKYDENKKYVLYAKWESMEEPKLIWETKKSFIEYMSIQSDYSLSGADRANEAIYESSLHSLNNQRITKKRLMDFVKS